MLKLPKTVSVEPLSGKVDSRISPLVGEMRKRGFNTISSCEGHYRNDAPFTARPNVVFSAMDRGLLHSWIRQVARSRNRAIVEFYMFPVWDAERGVVHEDNWMVWIDTSKCRTHKEAIQERDRAVRFLIDTLIRAASSRPLAIDSFVRSRW